MSENKENQMDKEVTDEVSEPHETITRIDADLSGISLSVETEGREECEELFNNVWDKMMSDAESMSESLSERMNSI